MKSLKSRITKGVLFPLALSLAACGDSDRPDYCEEESFEPNYIEGEVTKEGGTLGRNLVESRGALFGNESVRIGKQTYVVSVKTDKGNYVIDVVSWSRNRTLPALAEAIEVGTKLRFQENYCKTIGDNTITSFFSEDRIGSIRTERVKLLDN